MALSVDGHHAQANVHIVDIKDDAEFEKAARALAEQYYYYDEYAGSFVEVEVYSVDWYIEFLEYEKYQDYVIDQDECQRKQLEFEKLLAEKEIQEELQEGLLLPSHSSFSHVGHRKSARLIASRSKRVLQKMFAD